PDTADAWTAPGPGRIVATAAGRRRGRGSGDTSGDTSGRGCRCRIAPRPAGGPGGAGSRHRDARRVRGRPAEAEAGLPPAVLGALRRADDAVADRGEQVR